ncbi:asparagine synthase C-terminal domain-containing protein [Natronobacterium gregoryi]|uniref:Asparagine synthase n=2 Tax=Natronobacterium gregoryi TaxID=44930 RepID=L0ANS6_NATGS|nr:asparagine synthase-related protein [Natronobacterium gregoryi]AFZ74725.1 asparagine synthase (glutamine-hydrolyzing) [Natronobacterium gregoryi SP2]ELY73468.1 asparagine synthase [Natronobacterium gregoryi SP2]PLK20968.1 asparagine synthetase B [Natronobacterium gregoryi SP2]SFJ04003.1 asparagine synthase (glutamine-hydrolysing) [Natronobacterium gregoryi]
MTTLRGAAPKTVRDALERTDPLPGTAGFAGEIDGRLVRDVLGREPLFYESADAPDRWAFEPAVLEEPVALPAGSTLELAALEDETSDPRIQQHWTLPDPEPDPDHDAALEALEMAIRTAVDEVQADLEVAVAFSGGVDSALVAELLDAPLYVVGFPDSHDVEAARTAAEAMGRELTVVELEPADLERAVPEIARATGRTNAMDVQIALPLYLVGERVAADGFDALAVGQGADELFGGYEKVVRLDHRVEAETIRGAVRESILSLPEQLPRDVLTSRATGLEPVAPLLHDAVVDAALRLPDELLADEQLRKRGFRRVAARQLPEAVADRDKKAVQYGSLVARELDRLARQAGYKRRMDDHVSKYISSLLETG